MSIRDIYRELNKFTYTYLYNILSAKENDKRVHSSLPSFWFLGYREGGWPRELDNLYTSGSLESDSKGVREESVPKKERTWGFGGSRLYGTVLLWTFEGDFWSLGIAGSFVVL